LVKAAMEYAQYLHEVQEVPDKNSTRGYISDLVEVADKLKEARKKYSKKRK